MAPCIAQEVSMTKSSSTVRSSKVLNFTAIVNLSEIEKAYIAGFMDGEGLIGIYEKRRNGVAFSTCPRINISQIDPEILEWIQNVFGGAITKITRHDRGGDTYHTWTLENGDSIKPFLVTIYEYLRGKKAQAKLMLSWIEEKQYLTLEEQLDYVVKIALLKKSTQVELPLID